jgi:hypothetical protein
MLFLSFPRNNNSIPNCGEGNVGGIAMSDHDECTQNMRNLGRVVLLAPSLNEKSGWGHFTREFYSAFHYTGVGFELHLPPTESSSLNLPFAEAIRFDLPPPFIGIGRRWYKALQLWWKNRQISLQGDIIHSLIEFPYGIIAHWLACRYDLPFGITIHGTYAVDPLRRVPDRWLYSAALKNSTFITAVSNFTKQRLLGCIGLKRPVTVIHN